MTVILSIDVGIKNMSFCVFRSTDKRVLFWKCFEVKPGQAGDMCLGIVAAVGQLTAQDHKCNHSPEACPLVMEDVDRVVIERQPGRNQRIKCMEAYLHMYFVTQGKPVTIYSARHKLAGSGMENKGKGNSQYNARKKASVILAKQWLSENSCNADWEKCMKTPKSAGCKKLDDVTDALNQALAFCGMPLGQDGAAVALKEQSDTIRTRKPTVKQSKSGNFSRSNIKYFVCTEWTGKTRPQLLAAIDAKAKLLRSVQRHFGSVDRCLAALLPPAGPQSS